MSRDTAEYERLLHTAPPESIEQIHREAFEKLSPEERERIYEAMVARATEPAERPADATSDALAAAATAIEAKRPGTLLGLDQSVLNTYVTYAIGSELALGFLVLGTLPDGFPEDGGFSGDFDGGFDGGLA